MLDQA